MLKFPGSPQKFLSVRFCNHFDINLNKIIHCIKSIHYFHNILKYLFLYCKYFSLYSYSMCCTKFSSIKHSSLPIGSI